MNLTTIKALNEIILHGVTIEWTKEDKGIKEVRIRDTNGGRLVIRAATSYGDTLKLMVPQPYEEEDRYHLSGRFLDMCDVSEHFESKYDADAKLAKYQDKAGYGKEHGLKVEKVRVKINDAGKVFGAADPSPPDDLPF